MYRCLLSLAPEVSEPSKALNHNTTAALLSLSTAHRLQGIGDRSVSATPSRQRSVLMKLETFIPVESLFGYISSVSDPKSRIAAVANKQQLGVGNQQACSLYQSYDHS